MRRSTGTKDSPGTLADRFGMPPTALPCRHEPPDRSRDTGRKRLDASIEGRRCGCPVHGPGPAAARRRAGRRRRPEGQGEGRARSGSSTTGPPSGSPAPSRATSSGRDDGKFEPKAKPPAARRRRASRAPRGPAAAPSSSAPARSCSRWTAATGSARRRPSPTAEPTYSLVLTAGHCAYDEVNERSRTNWTYVPSFDTAPTFTCAQSTYGCWTAAGPRRPQRLRDRGRLQHPGHRPRLRVRDRRGGRQDGHPARCPRHVRRSPTRRSRPAAASTRSAIRRPVKYKGKDLTYCAGPTFNDPNNGNLTWGIACNMTGGSSGGPWLGRLHPGRRRHADLAELVRLQRAQQHVRPQVQLEHPGRLQPGQHLDHGTQIVN